MKSRGKMGSLALTLSLLFVVTNVAAQEVLSPPSEADQSSAVGSLRSINTAEVFYYKQYQRASARHSSHWACHRGAQSPPPPLRDCLIIL
jgi:hypothetical protein